MTPAKPWQRPALVAAVVLLIVIALLGGAVLAVRRAIDRNDAVELQVRAAQSARSRVFRAQLDEETGLRGFVATHLRVFLQPYTAARGHFPHAMRDLRAALDALGLPDDLARREAALNQAWVSTVAAPVLAGRSSNDLQLRGKVLVDALRSIDSQLYEQLNARAAQSDRDSLRLANAVAYFALPPIVLAAVFFVWYTLRQRSYEVERRVHEGLQDAMAPAALPAIPGIKLSAVYVPAGLQSRVGGDWYDALLLPDRRVLFSIGDVAGHGLQASVAMHRLRQTIVSFGMEEARPSEILRRANGIVWVQDGPIVTCVCGYFDPATRRISYSTAGHPPLIAAQASGEVKLLPFSGLPLGADASPVYDTHEEALPLGSLLVMYTDGLVEGTRDYAAGEAKVIEVIRRVNAAGAMDSASAIMREMFAGRKPSDDVAILTIAFEPAGVTDPQPSSRLPAAPSGV